MAKLAYQQILPYLPAELREMLRHADERQLAQLEELRLKPLTPPLCRFSEGEAFLSADGALVKKAADGAPLSLSDLHKTVMLLSDSSFYAVEEELRRGYITLPGGHRAGLCGRTVLQHGEIKSLKEISAVNIRIARPVAGLAAPLLPRLLDQQGQLHHTLIVSAPRGGKTTLLRDLIRALSDGEGTAPAHIGVVDERSELAAMRGGVPQLPIGIRSDVLDGCPKAEGITMLLRSMGPEIIVCDEIGREEDAAAIMEAIHGGVRMLCSAHASSQEELFSRPVLASLLQHQAFSRIVMLSRRQGPGTIEWVKDGSLQPC